MGLKQIYARKLKFGGATIITSSAVTRAAIVTLDAGKLNIGSIHTSSVDGRTHIKVAHGEAVTDWEKVTLTAAD
jgi:hypothetical protein